MLAYVGLQGSRGRAMQVRALYCREYNPIFNLPLRARVSSSRSRLHDTLWDERAVLCNRSVPGLGEILSIQQSWLPGFVAGTPVARRGASNESAVVVSVSLVDPPDSKICSAESPDTAQGDQ